MTIRPHYLVGEGDESVAYPASNTIAREKGRPILVIDPDDTRTIAPLMVALGLGGRPISEGLNAVRQLITPKPDEPTRLGAVVEDRDGDKWMRVCEHGNGCNAWQKTITAGDRVSGLSPKGRAYWSDVDAVEVIHA